MTTRLFWIIVVLLGMTVGTGTDILAQNLVGRSTRGVFGLKVGVISRMNMTGDRDLRSEVGSCIQVYADIPKGKNYYLSAAFDFYYIEINRTNQIMIEPNLGLKKTFYLQRGQMAIKPGGSVGFAFLADMGSLRASQYLTFKVFCEIHFKIDARKAWVGELALFHAPTGSSNRLDLAFGPGLMLRVGLAFR